MLDRRGLALIASILATLPATGRAQDPAPADRPPGGARVGVAVPTLSRRPPDALLVARPSVRRELGISEAQAARIARAGRARRGRAVGLDEVAAEGAAQEQFAPLQASAIAQLDGDRRASEAESDADLAAILDARQRARLAQIGLQIDGPAAFARDDVREAIGIDDDQAGAIAAILDEATRSLILASQARVDPSAVGSFAEALARLRRAVDRARSDATAEIALVLRRGQLDRFGRLLGEPLDVAGASPASSRPIPGPPGDG